MDSEIDKRKRACERADDAEWTELVVAIKGIGSAQREFLRSHPPGLVKALWHHFETTRGRCGCETPAHERPDCSVMLIERLLREDELS